ncbi:MAG: amidohydrolase family protein [Alphaproteobacteria bacterium]|nr:amidohydrolase family protein [Alphaproteobacteria bacterium]
MIAQPTSIRNASWAVTWDSSAHRHVYRQDVDIRINAGRIVDIVPAGAAPSAPDEATLDGRGMLVLPGLVNIHSHPTTEPAYRGVREDHGVPEQQMTGLFERMQAFRLDDAGRRAAAVMSYSEMLRGGTTTAMDLTGAFDGWFDTMAASGMRWYAAPAFASARWGMSAPQTVTWTWDEAGGRRGFQQAQAVIAQAEAHPCGRIKGVVFPAQIDTVEEGLLHDAAAFARDSGRLLTTHIAQAVVEVREIIRRYGVTSVQWAYGIGLLGSGTILGHCILLDDHPQIGWHTRRDLDLIADSGAAVAHCPQPFARYGVALNHFGRYAARGVTVGFGTDCAPHNLVEEMRLAIVAGRLMSADVHSVDTGSVFHAATAGGADALGRPDLGRLAPGAAADIVLVDLAHPLMQPARDPLRSFVFHAADRAVRTVLVDGNVVLRDGRPLGLDAEAAAAQVAESQARMLRDAVRFDYRGRHGDAIAPLSLPIQ